MIVRGGFNKHCSEMKNPRSATFVDIVLSLPSPRSSGLACVRECAGRSVREDRQERSRRRQTTSNRLEFGCCELSVSGGVDDEFMRTLWQIAMTTVVSRGWRLILSCVGQY